MSWLILLLVRQHQLCSALSHSLGNAMFRWMQFDFHISACGNVLANDQTFGLAFFPAPRLPCSFRAHRTREFSISFPSSRISKAVLAICRRASTAELHLLLRALAGRNTSVEDRQRNTHVCTGLNICDHDVYVCVSSIIV